MGCLLFLMVMVRWLKMRWVGNPTFQHPHLLPIIWNQSQSTILFNLSHLISLISLSFLEEMRLDGDWSEWEWLNFDIRFINFLTIFLRCFISFLICLISDFIFFFSFSSSSCCLFDLISLWSISSSSSFIWDDWLMWWWMVGEEMVVLFEEEMVGLLNIS